VIVVAVVLFIPAQMFLPFPYGLGSALFLLILGIVGVIVSRRNHNRREKFAQEHLKYQSEKDEPEESKKR